ncbi:EpsG family protein [Heyndrickxia acidicola]|uniref:EpsG family protein n=1 Tax=Heyndrickxia acidicola TaxID=209389 RepID=A0ABU6MKI6_9BACI|nr:EpsG family protein [Heyndrickxia acidicola]MED1205195.1 EpsG family protein [Heyndrickxia acidicola]
MTILWINLAIVFFLAFLARYFAIAVPSQGTIEFIKPNKLLVAGALFSLVIVSGLREGIGDTGAYRHAYTINNFTWGYITSQKDIGFGIFQAILKHFTNNAQVLIFLTALITNVLIIIVLYKYSRLFELSLYVYITNGWFLTSMNGMRQCLAAAIIFAATKFLFDGSWKKYFIVVLLASTIHETAFILLPLYFIVRRKAWTWTTLVIIMMAIVIVLGFNQFSEVLYSVIKDTQYGGYNNFSEGGANILRVAVDAAPLLIAFLGRHRLRQILPNSDCIVNLSIIGIVFMIVSTQDWIFARFSIYFSLYQLILISWIIKLFKSNNQRFIYYLIIFFYFIYHYYENVITLNIQYSSSFINLLVN